MFHKHRVLGGLAPRVLEWNETELRNLVIVASTEVNTDDDRTAFVKALTEVLA
jgi:glycine dehydrogenase subunit 1